MNVEPASEDRVPALAALLGRAFVDDPMLVWPFGPDRMDTVTRFFHAFDTEMAARGWLWEAGDAVGVAAIPPGSAGDMMEIDRGIRPTMEAASGRHAEFWEWIAERFRTSPSGTSTTSRSRPTNEVPASARR